MVHTTRAGPAPAAPGDGDSGASATEVARQIIQGFNNRDATALERLTCDGADEEVAETIGRAGQVDRATHIGEAQESGDTATASAVIVVAGSSMEFRRHWRTTAAGAGSR